ncbi:hypothetical protein D0T49_05875 [Paludibacter sp. 221]|uniref:NVEALA domain-containing protein n=1 Tax=Paludibacter sp. 221 TaxID=2302939 RepID=UPI0013D270D0|nr:NVEALA domain-containing protein [Paludibacter sp. 221]NDV46570.1 hypothetical protein [Paludibacter sp. 221]
MKKKIIIATAVFAFALVAAFNVNLNLKKESNLSVIALANLEALAGESSGGGKPSENKENGGGYKLGKLYETTSVWMHSIAGSYLQSTSKAYDCCVPSVQMNACNFNLEDSKCKSLR